MSVGFMRFSGCIIMQRKVYIWKKKWLLCTFYAGSPTFDAFSVEKLRERVENLSDLRENLSVSF